MRIRILALLLTIFYNSIGQELIVGNCSAPKPISNEYGVFVKTFCYAYMDNKIVGILEIEDHISLPLYGIVGGFLEVEGVFHRAKYFATYEPYGTGLKIETKCGVVYSNTDNLSHVWKTILNCLKEENKKEENKK